MMTGADVRRLTHDLTLNCGNNRRRFAGSHVFGARPRLSVRRRSTLAPMGGDQTLITAHRQSLTGSQTIPPLSRLAFQRVACSVCSTRAR